MNNELAVGIIRRFIKLPLEKRRQYLQQMLAEGISPANLPIPELRSGFERLPLSFAQQRQWFLWQMEPHSAAYHIPTVLRLRGELDLAALEAAFAALIARHETLRTTFVLDGDAPVQRVHEPLPLPLEVSPRVDESALQATIAQEIARPFDLEQGPLLRVRLLQQAADEHVLVMTLHHIVADGWSMPVMVEELVGLYQGNRLGEPLALPPLAIQYADYAIWQRRWMEAGEQERQLQYWTQQLGGEQPVLELPLDRPRPPVQSLAGARMGITLDQQLAARLKALAQQQGVTLFMLLLASFQALLHRYTNLADIRVGVPTANRNRVEAERLIGFFVNTQVLKAEFDVTTTVAELLAQVKHVALQAQAHQDLPFEQLVEALQPERNLSHTPLFQVMFNHQTQVKGQARVLQGLSLENLGWEAHSAPFDLTLETFESEGGLSASLLYARALFDASTVERLADHWKALLVAMVVDPSQRIAALPLLNPLERELMLTRRNQAAEVARDGMTLLEHFDAQVAVRPAAIALVAEQGQLSYAQLAERSNQLAHHLRARGVMADVPVGLAMGRGLDMVVGLLAILRAGGAYVPLDPDFPAERLGYMMQASGLRLLLSHGDVPERLDVPASVEVLRLDQDAKGWAEASIAPPLAAIHPEHLAYVIYTSGSTGRPKGVAVSHGALANFLGGMSRALGAQPRRVLALTSLSFDIAALELYWPLVTGGTVVLLQDGENKDPHILSQIIQAQGVELIQATPSTWRMLSAADALPDLTGKTLLCGGEALPTDLAQTLLEKAGTLWNMYGPTETTIWSAVARLTTGEPVTLGAPVDNNRLYALGADLEPVVAGCAAELYIGGDGLARGYFGQPGLTAERFLPDPSGHGKRLYRTGDRVRMDAQGVCQYLGRVDHQVKIRGLRIELGEIEARLTTHPRVREAAVIDLEGQGGTQLVAYVVLRQEGPLPFEALKAHLKGALPDYMVPTLWVPLASLPLTPNRKLDRKALPRPDAGALQQDFEAPHAGLEQQVAGIWAEVLKIKQVGRTDDFFSLGGHSLLATQVMARVRRELQIDAPLKALFEAGDLASFAMRVAQERVDTAPALASVARDGDLALSYAQQRQWFLWQLEPQSAAYNIPAALRLRGALDVARLRQAFNRLIERHEPLRTTFRQDAEQAIQVIHASLPLSMAIDSDPVADLRQWVEAEAAVPFDLEQGPLLRVRLLQLAEDDHVLVVTLHHIVADGQSMPVLVDELVQLYQGAELPPLAIQYADFAAWQRQWMEAGEQARQLSYWTQQLGGEQPVLELPLDRPRPSVQDTRGAAWPVALDAGLSRSLKALAREQGVTLAQLLLASFQLLLARYSGQADIRVGMPIANRTRLETERLIGFFVNTQVLKAEFDGELTVSGLLAQVKRTAIEAQAHQDLPFEQLVEALSPARNLGISPLFQALFNHQTEVHGDVRELPGLRVEGVEWGVDSAKFDLSLNTFDGEQGIHAGFSYATALFDAATIGRMAGHWRNLLVAMVADVGQRVAQLPMLNDEERSGLIAQWNPTLADYPSQACLHQVIETQAARHPDAIALVFEGQHLSYAELNRRANRIAHHLRQLGVGPDVLVGLAVERSLEMVVGLVAILKAGGAYLPLDPDSPGERLAYIIDDAGLTLLLAQQHLCGVLPVPANVQCLALEAAGEGCPEHNPVNLTTPASLAYVIYTSGSTGKPKGTLLPHHNVLRLFEATARDFAFDESDVWTLFHSYAFDFSVWEIFGALLYGGRLVIVPRALTRSPEDFHGLLAAEQVTVLNQTPSAFKQLMPVACASDQGLALRHVVFGGEALEIASLAPWFERFGDQSPRLINMYGITETTVHVTFRPVTLADLGSQAVSPIGRAIDDLSWYVLDGALNPVAPGCTGELHVGRAGLARGYLGRPALTAERFIPDPFAADGGRLYRTGDLANAGVDGAVEYIGRIDHQVKIRGFRIELGEIAAQLHQHPLVREAAVVDVEGPLGKQLVGYLVPKSAGADPREALKAHLKTVLPDYMVPAHLVLLERLPLTTNGKLDRKALPAPEVEQQAYVAPVGETEQQVAAIWADVLKVEQVGRDDNFFSLGGHSLLATQVMARVRSELQIDAPLRALFEAGGLAEFAALVEQGHADTVPVLTPVDRATSLELSYAQQRLWFLWQLEPDGTAYNIPSVLHLRGALDLTRLRGAFARLIDRHEPLRTTFRQEGDRAVQVIHASLPFEVKVDTATDARLWVEAEAKRPFDLLQGPMLRVRLLQLAEDDHVLVLTLHHIVADGQSMPVLVDELVQFYQGVELPPLAIQYADFAAWQRQWMEAGEQERQLGYWTRQLGGEQPVLELPLDRPRPSVQDTRGAALPVALDANLSLSLKALAREQGVTLAQLLLASFQLLLARYSGQADIRVGMPIANRTRLETERLIGFFVNTQVLKAEFDGELTVSGLLAQVRRTAIEAQAHQDLPFEQLVEALAPARNLGISPLFQALFNHQTEVRGDVRELPGLRVEGEEWGGGSAKFDLSLSTFDGDHGIHAGFTYATALFDEATIARMAKHWLNLLVAMVADVGQRVAQLPMLDTCEQQALAASWQREGEAFPRERCVHELIATRAAATPNATALVFADQALTYAELDRRANQIAHRLKASGAGPDVLVGIAAERSVEMIVGLLGILKAGSAYVPLDPEYPRDRLAYMIEDSRISLLLTQAHLLEQLPVPEQVECLLLQSAGEGYPVEVPDGQVMPSNLAYVIYTSGSTGRPKGAAVRHDSFINLLQWFAATCQMSETDKVMLVSSYSFDLTQKNLYAVLCMGGELHLPGPGYDPQTFRTLIGEQGITVLNCAPSAFLPLLEPLDGRLDSLRHVLLGGEPVKSQEMAAWLRHPGNRAKLHNSYGPTECTDVVIEHVLEAEQVLASPSMATGRPIRGASIQLLDGEGQWVAPGALGEIHIAGGCVGQGYWHQPALTAERFVPDEFADGGRCYRTGDLARYTASGVLEYAGRRDHQVKIRGLRIELGEIEAQVKACAGVKETVVLAVDDVLVAYVVPQQVGADPRADLKQALKGRLPDYMMPTCWMLLEAMPLNPNGKLDRKALPAPVPELRPYRAPETALEVDIARIWQQLLNQPRIGLDDSFFELGGHSLLATRLVSSLREELGTDVPLRLLFEHPTLGEFAQAIETQATRLSDDGLAEIEQLMNEWAEI